MSYVWHLHKPTVARTILRHIDIWVRFEQFEKKKVKFIELFTVHKLYSRLYMSSLFVSFERKALKLSFLVKQSRFWTVQTTLVSINGMSLSLWTDSHYFVCNFRTRTKGETSQKQEHIAIETKVLFFWQKLRFVTKSYVNPDRVPNNTWATASESS